MPLINLTQSYAEQWIARKRHIQREAAMMGVIMLVISSLVFILLEHSRTQMQPNVDLLDQQATVVFSAPEPRQPPLSAWIQQLADEPELARTLSRLDFQDAQLQLSFSATTNQLMSLLNDFHISSWQPAGYTFELTADGEPHSSMLFQWQLDDAN